MKASKHTASGASAKKKQGVMNLDKPKWQVDPSKHRPLGFRVHDENKADFPTVSLMVPDEAMGRRWAAERIQSGRHPDCGFRLEQVLLENTTYHLLAHCGELPDDPLVGPIEWEDADPLDLGPIWEQMTLENMQKMEGLPPAALAAAQLALKQQLPIYVNSKTETQANGESAKNGNSADKKSNGQATAKPESAASEAGSIGSAHPAPKPGRSAKAAKEGQATRAKLARAKRSHPHTLRAKSATKLTKRA
jgi:hypothetical protein